MGLEHTTGIFMLLADGFLSFASALSGELQRSTSVCQALIQAQNTLFILGWQIKHDMRNAD